MIETYSDHNIELPSGASGDVRTTCPQCSPGRKKQDEKCLAVTVEKGTWFCHHCGWTGGLKAEKSARPIPAPKTRAFKLPKPYAQGKLPEKVLEWFKSRGISEDTLLDNRVGYGTAWMPQIEGETTTIQFPYMDGETVVNVKYRDGKKNFRMEKGAERVLYGLNHIGKDLLVWVEGEIDKLSLWEIGVESCVSVPDGAPSADSKNYSSKFAFLDSAQKRLDGVRRHIIAVDSDAPGARLKIELVRRIGPEKCWTVEWPEDCKDANEVLQKYGKDRLFDCVDEAKPVPVAGVFEVDDIRRDVMDIYQYGFERGMKTGWPDVDAYYTVRQREWSVVTGIPGHGKSEWLDALMVNMARDHGWRFGICSMENYPLSRHFAKLAEKYVGMPFENLRDFPKMPESELEAALDWAQDHFFFLSPEDDDLTVDGVLKLARVLVYRHGINGLVIDPWNELEHSWERQDNEVRYISSMLTKIRRFARAHGLHIWVVAHPTKLQKNKDGTYPVPTPYDISGAAHWRNKADNAITVHRPNVSNWMDKSVEIHVQKIRFKEIGRPGCAVLHYDKTTGRYS